MIAFKSAGTRCGDGRREKASRSPTIRPTRVVSLEICIRYRRTSSTRSGGMPSSFKIRSTSMERLRTPAMGLLISCATLAASCPSDAKRSLWNSFWFIAFNCSVLCWTFVSRLCVNSFSSLTVFINCSRMELKEWASSPISPSALISTGRSSCIALSALVPAISFSNRFVNGRTHKKEDKDADDNDRDRGCQYCVQSNKNCTDFGGTVYVPGPAYTCSNPISYGTPPNINYCCIGVLSFDYSYTTTRAVSNTSFICFKEDNNDMFSQCCYDSNCRNTPYSSYPTSINSFARRVLTKGSSIRI